MKKSQTSNPPVPTLKLTFIRNDVVVETHELCVYMTRILRDRLTTMLEVEPFKGGDITISLSRLNADAV